MVVHLSVILVGSCWDGSRVVLDPVAVDGKMLRRKTNGRGSWQKF
jgi:hypothetical protein